MASVLVFVTCFFLAEFAVRFALPQLDPTQHIHFQQATKTKPVLGPPSTQVRQIKNTGDFNITVRFNADGLRDRRVLKDIRKSDFVLAGSSFTFGWGVKRENRISEQLETLIGKRVFNVSMTAGFDNYGKMLKYAARNGADIGQVIIAVTMETDIKVYSERPIRHSTKKQAANAPDEHVRLMRIKAFLMRNSALYFLATSLVHRTPFLKSLAVKFGLLTPNLEGVKKHEYSQEAITSSADYLARLASKYRSIVVLLPSRGLWHGNQKTTERKRHDRFVARLKNLGLSVVDLRLAFEATKDPLSLHFKNDGHWNPKGHALAAQALADFIKTNFKK